MSKGLNADRKVFCARVSRELRRAGLDALAVTSEAGVIYLTGFYCEGAIVLAARGSSLVYLVDQMNYTLAAKALKGLGITLMTAPGDKIAILGDILKTKNVRKLGVEEDTVTVRLYGRIKTGLKGIKLSDASGILLKCRSIKTPGEISLIREAAAETVSIWRSVSRKIRPGMTELRVASLIDVTIKERGYQNSFPTIAAAGPNTAYPHAIPTGRAIKNGEHLLVDFGIRFQGYCSDLTRVWGNDRIMRNFGLIRRHVNIIQGLTIKKIKAGVSVKSLADEANLYFEKNGLSKFVCHSLGHGVGLDIHEAPSLSSNATGQRLESGMVVTVEPGLYVPGEGGYRVEDMVLVKDGGCEVLTQ